MFKFLNTLPAKVTELTKPRVTIEEIHEAFNTEVDRLLEYANVRPAPISYTDQEAKADRLLKLGFNSSSDVTKVKDIQLKRQQVAQELHDKDKLISAINYFSMHYPNYKFITEASVKVLCNKYGLIYGPVSRFKGDVPAKNLEQIEKFKVKDEDCVYQYRHDSWSGNPYFMLGSYAHAKANSIRYQKQTLEIAAPMKDFDTTGMELKDFKLEVIPPKDPIVLCPVLHGNTKHFLIVTAWGPEATDELVVNQKFN
jgi:hypothetical protein